MKFYSYRYKRLLQSLNLHFKDIIFNAALLILKTFLYAWFIRDKEMSLTIYVALFLVVHIIHNEATVFNDVFAVQTNDNPKSSCHQISNIKSKSTCLGTCVISVHRNVMISHDESTGICMCCNDVTGSGITGSNWKSYVPRKYFLFFHQKRFRLGFQCCFHWAIF